MSGTIIDALVVTLGLDSKDWRKGRDEAKKDVKDLGDRAKESERKVDALVTVIGKLFAAFLAGRGLKDFVEDLTKGNTELERFSRNVGENVTLVKAWGDVATRSGGSAQGLQATMQMLSQQMTEIAVTGQSSLLPYFRALGVHLGDAAGHARPLTDILLDLSDRLSSMPRTTANNLGRMMGIDQGTLNALLGGRAQLQALIAEQIRLNKLTKESAERSERLTLSVFDLRQALDGMGRQIYDFVAPGLQWLVEKLTAVVHWLQEHKNVAIGLAATIGVALVPAIAAAATAVWALIGPMVLAAAPVIALGAALTLLTDDFLTWREGGESALGGFWQFWSDTWDKIVNKIPEAKEALMRSLTDTGEIVRNVLGGAAQYGVKFGPLGAIYGAVKGMRKDALIDRETKTFNELTSEGYTEQQAAGITAVLEHESNLDPTAVNPKSGAYGIGQWLGARKQSLFAFAAARGLDPSDLMTQLAFRRYEDQTTEKHAAGAVRASKTAREAAITYGMQNERYMGDPAAVGRPAVDAALADLLASVHVASAPVVGGATTNSTRSSETHIGQITVNTQATDAPGIVDALGPALRHASLADQADYGLN